MAPIDIGSLWQLLYALETVKYPGDSHPGGRGGGAGGSDGGGVRGVTSRSQWQRTLLS